jgi:hypothetical protein
MGGFFLPKERILMFVNEYRIIYWIFNVFVGIHLKKKFIAQCMPILPFYHMQKQLAVFLPDH